MRSILKLSGEMRDLHVLSAECPTASMSLLVEFDEWGSAGRRLAR